MKQKPQVKQYTARTSRIDEVFQNLQSGQALT